MAELFGLHVTLNAYKQLLGKNETSDQKFINWVLKETGSDMEDPIDPVDPIDPSTGNYTAKLHELSEMEMMVLLNTISSIEYYN